jgi:hypothetical protein
MICFNHAPEPVVFIFKPPYHAVVLFFEQPNLANVIVCQFLHLCRQVVDALGHLSHGRAWCNVVV